MINILIGPPGAGKSYEAVVYHVLPALLSGRKVITNLPLQLDALSQVVPGYRELVQLIEQTLENPKPFGTIDDYGSDWRGEGGIGPLYVIDECHKPLPKGATSRLVEEWYAEHRHEGADVLLITQGYGKISAPIRDMIQLVYRVRKATALGMAGRYIRKVQDGPRGEVVNETTRVYDPKHYPLYKSHTKTMGGVSEEGAKDVKPIWQHWSVIGACAVIPLGILGLVMAGSPFSVDAPEPAPVAQVKPVAYVPHNLRNQPLPESKETIVPEVKPEPVKHPYAGLGLHISGYLYSIDRDVDMYSIAASQNGQRVFRMTDTDLRDSGYEVTAVTPCLVRVKFDKFEDYITCDAPRQAVPL